jgi:hypothetical protein
MKPEHLKLAGVVTVVCGSMFSFKAGAALDDTSTVVTGTVMTLSGAPPDAVDASVAPTTDVVPAASESTEPADSAQASNTSNTSNAPPAEAQSDNPSPGTADDLASTQNAAHLDDPDPAWASADLTTVPDHQLDEMRGGFALPSGLLVSFGISRVAYVNGNLVTQTSFNIPDIANMTAQQAQMLANVNAGSLIQVGPHNTVQQGPLPGLTGAVIQNTLSNQQIQALTTINTSVNSLGAFKAMNFLSTLNSALTGAVSPR